MLLFIPPTRVLRHGAVSRLSDASRCASTSRQSHPLIQYNMSAAISTELGRSSAANSKRSASSWSASASSGSTSLPRLPIFQAIAGQNLDSLAVIHSSSGRSFTYGGLLGDVGRARERLREARNGKALDGERIAFLVENGYDYVGKHLCLCLFVRRFFGILLRCQQSSEQLRC